MTTNREKIEKLIDNAAADIMRRRGMSKERARAEAWRQNPELVEISRVVDEAGRKPPAAGPGTVGDRIEKAVDRWAVLQQHTNADDYKTDIGIIRARLWGSELGRRLKNLQRSQVAGEQFTKARGGIDPAVADFLDKWAR